MRDERQADEGGVNQFFVQLLLLERERPNKKYADHWRPLSRGDAAVEFSQQQTWKYLATLETKKKAAQRLGIIF